MKIAFLNPWRSAAENQAFRSLKAAAERIGHQLVHCTNSMDVEVAAPQFVLAAASTQGKMNDIPTYGVVHEARDRFLTNRRYFQNLLTYDGYLTISGSLEHFLRDVLYGAGREQEIGFYYNTCQRQERAADIEGLIAERRLRITYFGTNWDRRRPELFKRLSQAEGVQICGPRHSWVDIDRRSYGGPVSFDGDAVQARYRENGIGLCLLSEQHLRDDVISNRIFEITSVGAIAICCDIPWIRKHFGDTVYYVDQTLPDRYLARAILRVRDWIYGEPEAAAEKARRARAIFDERFAAEVLLANAVDYHERVSEARDRAVRTAAAAYVPFVSVIVRCGSRPPELIRRAVDSLARQTYGQFEVIFVRHGPVDLSGLLSANGGNIRSLRVVECPGGKRSASLWAGLAEISGDYFAILDDDDWLFSNHFERLFDPFPKGPQEKFLAYSGSISYNRISKLIEGGGLERRQIYSFGIQPSQDLMAVAAAFASNCWVASRDLLHEALRRDPQMTTAEDSYLVLSLLGQTRPRFSHVATSIHDRGQADQSNFELDPSRFEDELTLRTRLFGRYRPAFAGDGWEALAAHWKQRPSTEPDPILETPECIIHRVPGFPLSLVPEEALECVSTGYNADDSGVTAPSELVDAAIGTAMLRPPRAPWAYGAEFALRRPTTGDTECLLVVEMQVIKGEIGLGLLNRSGTEFLFRRGLRPSEKRYVVHVPVVDLRSSGRLVVQNWENGGPSQANMMSIRVLVFPDTTSGSVEGAPGVSADARLEFGSGDDVDEWPRDPESPPGDMETLRKASAQSDGAGDLAPAAPERSLSLGHLVRRLMRLDRSVNPRAEP